MKKKGSVERQLRRAEIAKSFRLLKNPFFLVMFIFCLFYAATLVYALVWGLLTSLKTSGDFYGNLFGLPQQITFANYGAAYKALYMKLGKTYYYLFDLYFYSFVYAFANTAVGLISTCFCAYLVQKYKCKFSSFIYNLYLVMLVIPIVGNIGANLSYYRMWGVYDSFLGQLFTRISFMGPFFLMYASFAAVSDEYMAAASIDGAGHWRTLLQIMFPMIRVTFFISFITQFIPYWNDYMSLIIYLPSYPAVAVALYRFQMSSNQQTSSVTVRMAGTMLVAAPCLVLFVAFKEQLMGNLTLGGLKG